MVKKHYSCLIASLLLILSGCSTDGLKPAEEPLASPENSEFVSGTAVLLVSEDAADGFENIPRTKAFDAIGIERIERVFPDAGELTRGAIRVIVNS